MGEPEDVRMNGGGQPGVNDGRFRGRGGWGAAECQAGKTKSLAVERILPRRQGVNHRQRREDIPAHRPFATASDGRFPGCADRSPSLPPARFDHLSEPAKIA